MQTATLKIEPSISNENWTYLTSWRERVFPEEGRAFLWQELSLHATAYNLHEQAIAHIGFGPSQITKNQQPMRVIGIGGVVVHPEYQGRGLPMQLFNKIHAYFKHEIFALFCPKRLCSYYQKYGYVVTQESVTVLQNSEVTQIPFALMTYPKSLKGNLHIPSHPW